MAVRTRRAGRRAQRWRWRSHTHGMPASALSAAGMQPSQHVERCSTLRAVLSEATSSTIWRAIGRPQGGRLQAQRRGRWQPWGRRRRKVAHGKVALGCAVANLTVHQHSLRRHGNEHDFARARNEHGVDKGPYTLGASYPVWAHSEINKPVLAHQLLQRMLRVPAGTGSPQVHSSAVSNHPECRVGTIPPPAAMP